MLVAAIASAADSPDDVLVRNAQVSLERSDYTTALERIPRDLRDEFATSARRITALLNNVLITKTLAARARLAGLQPEPGLPQDTPADLERALAAAQTRATEEAAGAEFDARRDVNRVIARETYLLATNEYRRPEEIRISAILLTSEGRGKDAALALARATREKLIAWADFSALARELSDDKASAPNGGQLPWASEDRMHPALAKAAFALKVGEISEPVNVGVFWIIARLDERRPAGKIPFAEVQDIVIAKMRTDYINNARDAQLDAIRNDPTMVVNQPAVDALVVRIDPSLFKTSPENPPAQATPPVK